MKNILMKNLKKIIIAQMISVVLFMKTQILHNYLIYIMSNIPTEPKKYYVKGNIEGIKGYALILIVGLVFLFVV